eukprot:scaffold338712_cov103-Cyclotella_meneghiniana.AAC.2
MRHWNSPDAVKWLPRMQTHTILVQKLATVRAKFPLMQLKSQSEGIVVDNEFQSQPCTTIH